MRSTLSVPLLIAAFIFTSVMPSTATLATNKFMVLVGPHMFVAQAPDGWTGDTKDAGQYQCSIVFYPNGQKPSGSSTIITVALWPKEPSVPVSDELQGDMKRYRQRYPYAMFEQLTENRAGFHSYAKVYVIPMHFTDYVAYLDPGAKANFYFIVSLQPGYRPKATAAELYALAKVIKSLTPAGTIQ